MMSTLIFTLLAKTNRDLHAICHSDHAVGLSSMFLSILPYGFSMTPCAVIPVATATPRAKLCAIASLDGAFLPWELEGITSPCCLLIGQYPHHDLFALPSPPYLESSILVNVNHCGVSLSEYIGYQQ